MFKRPLDSVGHLSSDSTQSGCGVWFVLASTVGTTRYSTVETRLPRRIDSIAVPTTTDTPTHEHTVLDMAEKLRPLRENWLQRRTCAIITWRLFGLFRMCHFCWNNSDTSAIDKGIVWSASAALRVGLCWISRTYTCCDGIGAIDCWFGYKISLDCWKRLEKDINCDPQSRFTVWYDSFGIDGCNHVSWYRAPANLSKILGSTLRKSTAAITRFSLSRYPQTAVWFNPCLL